MSRLPNVRSYLRQKWENFKQRVSDCFDGCFNNCGSCDPWPYDCDIPDFSGWHKPDCSMPDCDLPDCDGCDGCDGCDLGTLMIGFVFATALLNYFKTAPVREGRLVTRPLLRLVRSYQQHVSAKRPAVCNLSPTCSAYGYNAIREHGINGLRLTRARLRECRDAGHRKRHQAHAASKAEATSQEN